MSVPPRIVSAEPVIHGVLKIVWNDGYEGVVDLRPVISRGRIFTYLQDRENFRKLSVEDFGHSVGWTDADGAEIDFGSDTLRMKAESQAELNQLVSNLRV
ncbi:hypothetical protein GCM10008171_02350 [Methylopila jiangsuensis]|uniref:DUF2442 domain-containing protein n=1 Tax=Methylopila jiangsuensis TaxID=586230 RepID=A0A9W6N287_9HYPH|nr:DUF2442 domain-containing protein [Methylopila jiangsuensis]MDR6287400.1 hypothetical protein [Methylopila jiangsuensis]GLK74981.1 hypothetical protein GCM10008171_02350 [Methylopila jiangsuensis]